MGGSLRLASIASIDNNSFEENVFELGGVPVVFNNGYVSNVFKYEGQMFLHLNEVCFVSYFFSLRWVDDIISIREPDLSAFVDYTWALCFVRILSIVTLNKQPRTSTVAVQKHLSFVQVNFCPYCPTLYAATAWDYR